MSDRLACFEHKGKPRDLVVGARARPRSGACPQPTDVAANAPALPSLLRPTSLPHAFQHACMVSRWKPGWPMVCIIVVTGRRDFYQRLSFCLPAKLPEGGQQKPVGGCKVGVLS